MDALADHIQTGIGTADAFIDGLNVYPRMEADPTPPAIDIYPADPSSEQSAFGIANREVGVIVRARINTPAMGAAQDVLLTLLDPNAATFLGAAVEGALEVKGAAGTATYPVSVSEGPSGFGAYTDPGGDGAYLGFQLTAKVIL